MAGPSTDGKGKEQSAAKYPHAVILTALELGGDFGRRYPCLPATFLIRESLFESHFCNGVKAPWISIIPLSLWLE